MSHLHGIAQRSVDQAHIGSEVAKHVMGGRAEGAGTGEAVEIPSGNPLLVPVGQGETGSLFGCEGYACVIHAEALADSVADELFVGLARCAGKSVTEQADADIGVLAYGAGFVLTSNDIGGQLTEKQVYSGFGCSGQNISPQLSWVDAPGETKSFAVTVYDPDAPTGSGWWHWLIFNIPATARALAADAGNPDKGLAPKGSIQSMTDYGKTGFGGACPPAGDKPHRYIFTVYALGLEKLPLDATASPAMVGFYLNHNAIAKASIIAYYGR